MDGIMFLCLFNENPNAVLYSSELCWFGNGRSAVLARSTYSKFLPETEDTTSYFSFYDVAEKIGIVIGMVIFAFIDQITGSMRNGILFLVLFFLGGIILLFRVPKENKIH